MCGWICKEKRRQIFICLPKGLELVEEVVDYFFCQTVHERCVVTPVKTEVAVGGFGDLDAIQGVEGEVVVVKETLDGEHLLIGLHLATDFRGRALGHNALVGAVVISAAYLLHIHGVADNIQVV